MRKLERLIKAFLTKHKKGLIPFSQKEPYYYGPLYFYFLAFNLSFRVSYSKRKPDCYQG
ncbi:MAG: hypothetical protein AB1595_05525 [bacterium]